MDDQPQSQQVQEVVLLPKMQQFVSFLRVWSAYVPFGLLFALAALRNMKVPMGRPTIVTQACAWEPSQGGQVGLGGSIRLRLCRLGFTGFVLHTASQVVANMLRNEGITTTIEIKRGQQQTSYSTMQLNNHWRRTLSFLTVKSKININTNI